MSDQLNRKKDSATALAASKSRREFIKNAAAGTVLIAMGGAVYRIAGDELTRKARAETRSDGRRRLPPGQKVIEKLRPMGGQPGSSKTADFKLKVYGECANPFTLDWNGLLALPQTDLIADVHCVTGWSMLGGKWRGVLVSKLAEMAKTTRSARHVIFESAHGYTANVSFKEATAANCLVTHRLDNKALRRSHGAPVRALIPNLYFWKSSKWLTGIRFVKRDVPGFWETRGYHNHGNPWKEERYG